MRNAFDDRLLFVTSNFSRFANERIVEAALGERFSQTVHALETWDEAKAEQ